ncbi:hypothetical protein LX36DRAFT_655324 [Colletotrichum falcatum]|nr:hypothetical protein LX36DRAFT_655324 [Colletotrichum falcatum]
MSMRPETSTSNPRQCFRQQAGFQILFRIPAARIPYPGLPRADDTANQEGRGLIHTNYRPTGAGSPGKNGGGGGGAAAAQLSLQSGSIHFAAGAIEAVIGERRKRKKEPAVPTERCGPAAFLAPTLLILPPPLIITGLLATLHLAYALRGIALCSPVRMRGLLHGDQVSKGGGPFPWCRSCQHIALVLGTTSQDILHLTVACLHIQSCL